MTIDQIKEKFPALRLTQDEWNDLAMLTEEEDREFPVAMGAVRFGLLAAVYGELIALSEHLVNEVGMVRPSLQYKGAYVVAKCRAMAEAALGGPVG